MSSYAIALSGGGARGIAHLGVLQALGEVSIKPVALSGTSAGAILGAFYAAGYAPKEILKIITETSFFKLLRPAISTSGLLDISSLSKVFQKYIPDTYEELNTSLTVNATNLDTGESVYFSKGKLIDSILAASCIPAVFKPVEINGNRYVDGGMLDNLPIRPFLKTNHKIIGVHTNPIYNDFKATNAKQIVERCLLMAVSGNVLPNIGLCHYYIEPPLLGQYGGMNISNASELYRIGYTYTKSYISHSKMSATS